MSKLLKQTFPETERVTYLDTAAEGLPPKGCLEALAAYHQDKASGSPGRPNFYRAEQACRESLGQLLGCKPDDVALVSNASEALNTLAGSLTWSDGDEVVICDLEFPSNVLAWLKLREKGVKIIVVESDAGRFSFEQFAEVISSRTRLVSLSHVSYKTGTRIPFLSKIGELTHQVGGIFCVDATQSLGRVPVPLDQVDYLVCSTYKWLLGVHGLGVVYCTPELRKNLVPASLGWYSVKDLFSPSRFEKFTLREDAGCLQGGMPNFPSIYALRHSVDYLLSQGVERTYKRLAPLVGSLREGLHQLGLVMLTPSDPQLASGIVSFEHAEAESLGKELAEQRIIVWGGDGRVRASVHLYNDEEDIVRILGVMEAILERRETSVV